MDCINYRSAIHYDDAMVFITQTVWRSDYCHSQNASTNTLFYIAKSFRLWRHEQPRPNEILTISSTLCTQTLHDPVDDKY